MSEELGLQGVHVYPLRVIDSELGAVLHMLRADHPAFDRFGEVYFSEVAPKAIKGWKLHREMTQRLAAPIGEVVFYLKDGRPQSTTFGNSATIRLSRAEQYNLLVIPPGVWYAFHNPGSTSALIANVADLPHSAAEVERRDLTDPYFTDAGNW